MNNEITLTVEGWVARPPQHYGREDSTWVTFRVGSTAWWWDSQGERRDAPTTWFDVKVSQKDLAENVLLSVKHGDAVIVTGRLSQHFWTDRDGRERTSMQITARSIGHNLRWGKAGWSRRSAEAPAGAPAGAALGAQDPAPGNAAVPNAQAPSDQDLPDLPPDGDELASFEDPGDVERAFGLADAAAGAEAPAEPSAV
ncbi:MAG: single-stranded DNA-binding protein [Bifidobacteriaceae bacterium]|jgi:single-strand DNA-binding protein|nr:single-stranded DNA-binding protein [Bifidobacteriaceae bacterium]